MYLNKEAFAMTQEELSWVQKQNFPFFITQQGKDALRVRQTYHLPDGTEAHDERCFTSKADFLLWSGRTAQEGLRS
jgi:hypothetical protein